MRLCLAVALLLSNLAAATDAFAARLEVLIDISSQRMLVEADGDRLIWPVSTARRGYRTPVGRFHPVRLERTWFSMRYDSAPMPYSIFFDGGYAINGTYEIGRLGHAVSHGCVRLHPANARRLFQLVQEYGKAATDITITP